MFNPIPDGDYTLEDGAAWLTVNGFSVRINANDGGVVCDVYKLGAEYEDAIIGFAVNAEGLPHVR